MPPCTERSMTRKLLLDIDPGCDDAVMTTMALGSDDVEVVGITTVAGNSTVENTTRNALAVLEYLGRNDIPVARGAGQPINDELVTAEWVHGEGGIRGDLPEPMSETVDDHAVEFILRAVREHGDELTLVATGMLTNLAGALIQEPSLSKEIDELHLMGGAAMTVGNITPAAEANFYKDPVAAKRVVGSTEPRIATLDALDDATVSSILVEEFKNSQPPLDAVGAWMDYPEEILEYGNTDDPIVHDAAVVADIIDGVLEYESYHIDVDTSQGQSRGALLADRYGVRDEEPNAEVAVSIDTEGFRKSVRDAVESA